MHVLFVCTANQCRSPIAEALFRKASPRLWSSSAGLLRGGHPVPEDGVQRMAAAGLDLSTHRSVQVTSARLMRADLIVGMARYHVRELVVAQPTVRARTFTLKDLVRRIEAVSTPLPDLATLLRDLDAARPIGSLFGNSASDDVADPIGRPGRVWDAVVAELSDHTARLAGVLDGVISLPSRDSPSAAG